MIGVKQAEGGRLIRWQGILFALYAGLAVGYVALWLTAAGKDLLWRADFSAFYTGWAMVRDGLGGRLYDFDLQAQYQVQILGGQSFKGGLLPFNYPPQTALLFPLAWLSRPVAFGVWSGFQLILLVWVLRRLGQVAREWDPAERRFLWIGVLAFPPLFSTFLVGTFSLIVTACLLEFYFALKAGREMGAGMWLFWAGVKPQNAILPGVMVVGARRWRALGGGILAGGITVIITSLLWGWQTWPDFLRMLIKIGSSPDSLGITAAAMYNLKGVLAALLDSGSAAWITGLSLAGFLVSLGAGGWLWRGKWDAQSASFDLRFSLTLLIGLLFSLHLNAHDSLIAVIPAALFYNYLRQQGLPRRKCGIFLLSCPWIFLISYFGLDGTIGYQLPVLLMIILAGWIGAVWARPRDLERQQGGS